MNISPITQDGYQVLDSHCPDVEMIHVPTGNVVRKIEFFRIPTLGAPLTFSIFHNSRNLREAGDVGIGWSHSLQAQLSREDSSATLVTFTDETGRSRQFEKVDGRWQMSEDSLFANLHLTEVGNGDWILSQESGGKRMRFRDQAGTPILSRLIELGDSSANQINYVFDDDKLTAVVEPVSGRAITVGWTDDRITSVSDPLGNEFTLSYTDDLLSSLEMPGGCLVEFAYDEDNQIATRSDVTSASTLYTYDELGRLIQVEGPEQDEERPTAQWEYSVDPVNEIANLSPDSDPSGAYIELTQVFFTSARGKVWEYRFLPSSMLWREIDPLGHHRRYFYDDRQNLLYSSEGFARKNQDDSNDTELDHPRDNINNQTRSQAWDEKGNLLQSIDANGLVTTYSYGPGSELLSVYPGQAHYGLGGNWREHFAQDGYVLCAHQSDGNDSSQLPTYVDTIAADELRTIVRSEFTLEQPVLLSSQVLQADVPSVGQWTCEGQEFVFAVVLSESKPFNLSLYTNSLDQLDGMGAVLDYPEFFGREVLITVTDRKETQSFRVTQNAGGVWVTFAVVGDEEHPVVVKLSCPQSNHRPTLSALAFDPYEDRRTRMMYDPNGKLSKVIQPTLDPQREVAEEYYYGGNGLLTDSRQVLRVSGEVEEQRITRLFYEDSARNLTRLEDPLNGAGAPTVMEYDDNSNLVHTTDPDGKEMHFEYDYRRRLTKVTDGNGNFNEMTYDLCAAQRYVEPALE